MLNITIDFPINDKSSGGTCAVVEKTTKTERSCRNATVQ